MKKLLLLIPLSVAISAFGQSGETKDATQTKEAKKMSLDGKAFKVAFTEQTSSISGGTSDRSMNSTERTTGTAGDMRTSAGQPGSAGSGTESGTRAGNTNDRSQGTQSTQSGSQSSGTSVSGTTDNSGTGVGTTGSGTTTSGGTTTQGTAGNTMDTDDSRDGNISGTGTAENRGTKVDDDATMDARRDNTSAVTGTAGTSVQATDPVLKNKKAILRFENGVINSSLLSENQISECPYNVTASEGNTTSFTSNCRSTATSNRATWSGTVEGNKIQGNLSWTLNDGRTVSYSFTGSAATQKDLDSMQELGLK